MKAPINGITIILVLYEEKTSLIFRCLENIKNFKIIIVDNAGNISLKKNVIRGLHFQKKFSQHKIIFVLKGIINDFVVDIRKNSKTFSKVYNFTLTSGDALIIPKGFAHGYSSLAKENIVIYFLSEDWYPNQESGIIWNDKFLNINWGVKKPIVSKKDKLLKTFLEL